MTSFFCQALRQLAAMWLLGLSCLSIRAQAGSDPFATYLQAIPPPVFNPTNRLQPLTYCGWGWQLSNATVQLATKFGYAANPGLGPTPYGVSQAATPGTMSYGLAQRAKANANFKIVQTVYKQPILGVLPDVYNTNNSTTGRWFGEGYYCTNSTGQYVDSGGRFSDSALYYIINGVTNGSFQPVQSPCAPASELQRWTDCQILMLKMFNSNCPMNIVENDGEWGLQPYTSNYKAFWSDPRFIADMNALGVSNTIPPAYNTDYRIYEYLSMQKAREMNQLTDAVRTNFPGVFYFFYNTSMEKFRNVDSTHHVSLSLDGMNSGDGWDSAFVATNLAFPTSELYYKNSNTGMTNAFNWFPAGATTNLGLDIAKGRGLLLEQLAWKAWNITQGKPLSYDYLTSGWTPRVWLPDPIYDDGHYTGFLKCLYAIGMIGGNMGWYGNDGTTNAHSLVSANFNAPFSVTNVPSWMMQMVLLSRVHAQFSWLADYLYDGSLVPSPYTNAMSQDLNLYDWAPEGQVGGQYLPGGYANTNLAHVFIRKLNASDNWLLTAWTSDTANASVTITNIPMLGTVTLNARTNGAVYLATPTTLTLQDTNGDYPTEWRGKPAPPPNFRVKQ
jgi:hypothetical protein